LGDGFVAVCQDLKISMSGPTQEAVLLDMWFAIDAFYAECMVRGKSIPVGSTPQDRDIVLCPSANIQAKVALHQAFRDSGMSKGKLGQALGMDYSALNRLFDPRTECVNDFAAPCFMNLRCRAVLFQSLSFALAVG
jgi:hypothetical protein